MRNIGPTGTGATIAGLGIAALLGTGQVHSWCPAVAYVMAGFGMLFLVIGLFVMASPWVPFGRLMPPTIEERHLATRRAELAKAIPQLVRHLREGRTLKAKLLREFRTNVRQYKDGVLLYAPWQSHAVQFLDAIATEQTSRFLHDYSPNPSGVFNGTNAQESDLLNHLEGRLTILADVIHQLEREMAT